MIQKILLKVLIVIIWLNSISNSAQITKINLDTILVYKKTDVIKIIKKAKLLAKKNFSSNIPYKFNINHFGIKNKDTIINFDGCIENTINYHDSNLLLGNAKGRLLNYNKRQINIDFFNNMFPNYVNKKIKNRINGGASNKIPFFLTGVFNTISFLNNDFLINLKNYEYSIENEDSEQFTIIFKPLEQDSNEHPFTGYFTICKKDFAFLQIMFSNQNDYLVNIADWQNRIDKINVFLTFKKSIDTKKYILNTLNSECNFKDLIDKRINLANYYSKTFINIANKNDYQNEIDNEIHLTDLGLIFKN